MNRRTFLGAASALPFLPAALMTKTTGRVFVDPNTGSRFYRATDFEHTPRATVAANTPIYYCGLDAVWILEPGKAPRRL